LDARCVLEEAEEKRARVDERVQADEFLARAARLRNALMSVLLVKRVGGKRSSWKKIEEVLEEKKKSV
jgi:hypothetical protein